MRILSEREMGQLVKRQNDFFKTGMTFDITYRIKQLKKLKTIITLNKNKILTALKNDFYKPDFEIYLTEILALIHEIDYVIKNIKKWSSPKKVNVPFIYWFSDANVFPEPYGTVLIIASWNLPFHLTFYPLIGALASGNTAILKPSEVSSDAADLIYELISTHFDDNYIACVVGDVEMTKQLLKNDFNFIFFTGSTEKGKLVMQSAASRLIPVALELGGKNPCIVDDTVNLDKFMHKIIWGKCMNAGQICLAPDYFIIHYKILNEFINKFKDGVIKFYGSNPQNSKDYSRIINLSHFNRLKRFLSAGEVMVGGKFDEEDRYIEPTLLKLAIDDALAKEEIFGPIALVFVYHQVDEIKEMIRHFGKPLALYLFTDNKQFKKMIIREIPFGGGCVNDTIIHSTFKEIPFGGVGLSGIGKYHGKASFDLFSNMKGVVHKYRLFDFSLRYPPYLSNMGFMKWLKF